MRWRGRAIWLALIPFACWAAPSNTQVVTSAPSPHARMKPWDTQSDTWACTDALGRVVPGYEEVGPPRRDRFVGVFYFVWHGNEVEGGPFDISSILTKDPTAITDPQNSLWGPVNGLHHWGRSLFGYYLSDDEYVLRKHAQMLSDAGVDVVIFDVTNGVNTFTPYYQKLLKVFSDVRDSGGRTPQVAFLCSFGNPGPVVRKLYQELYGPGLYRNLWFRWRGKPLILADPTRLGTQSPVSGSTEATPLEGRKSLGQSFEVKNPFDSVGAQIATYRETNVGFTLSLYQGDKNGRLVAQKVFDNAIDNSWQLLGVRRPLPAGPYYLEISQPKGAVGWWTGDGPSDTGQAFADGLPVNGARSLEIFPSSGDGGRIGRFFTFRTPKADYFSAPDRTDMWSWLEVSPQHVFKDAEGRKEEMSVGVAQNAVGDRLGAMTEPGARGRSWHDGAEDTTDGVVAWGRNFAEQFERALKEDPELVFVTGWNEWVVRRLTSFPGVKQPVIFVDEFNEEYSRDIEPMLGGHGDDYYYQLVSYVRRYKGVHPAPIAGNMATIDIDGTFSQWKHVRPEYRDDIDDISKRDHDGWNSSERYVNNTGRNDFVSMKVARDQEFIYFYARTKDPITPRTDPAWMTLFLKIDPLKPSWEGYNFVVNRTVTDDRTSVLEASTGGWNWQQVSPVRYRVVGNELHLAIRRADLGLGDLTKPFKIQFKWMDNMQKPGDVNEFTLNGDAAPNGRFTYQYIVTLPDQATKKD